MKNHNQKIYSAKSIYRHSLGEILKDMLQEAVSSKELTWQLFLRDYKARYKQSLVGWLWIFLMPIITMATFLALNVSGIIKIGNIPVPYPIYGLLGFSLWQIFSNGWLLLSGSIVSAGTLVSQINFPRVSLVVSYMGQVLMDFLIRLVLVLIVYLIYGLSPSIWIIIFPLFLLPLILLTLGLSFISSLLNVIMRDTKDIIGVVLNFLLFLMPIMYVIPEKGLIAKINQYNPIFFLVTTPRDIIVSGAIEYPKEYFLSSLLALFIFILGWYIFYISQPKIAERI